MTQHDFEFPNIRPLLDELGFRPSKYKSQHFLHHREACEKIAALCELTPTHRVVEIGTGLGNLSCELARHAGRVVSVEMDETFREWHAKLEREIPNLDIFYGDFLKVDLDQVVPREPEGPLVVCGNLPYQITAPILFRLLEADAEWERIVAMVQLEVAERIVAGPGTRRASALTYKLALDYDSEIAAKIGPKSFIPPPKVNSAVVVLTPKAAPLARDRAHRARLHRIISGVFQHRRRTMSNALKLGGIVENREQAEAALRAAGLEPSQRPETLGLEDFLRLEKELEE